MAEEGVNSQIGSLELEIKENSEQASKGLDSLIQTLEKLKGAISGSSGFKNVAVEASKAAAGVNKLNESLSKVMNKSTKGAREKLSAPIKNLHSQLDPVINKLEIIGNNIAKLPFNFIRNGFSSVGNAISGAASRIGHFLNSLGRIFMYRSIRTILSEISNGFKEGTQNAYQFSKATGGTLSNSLDRVSTSMLYLRNSIGAAVAPLINALAPAIEFVVGKLVQLINFVNQVVSSFTGQKTWLKAKTYMTEYAESANKATNVSTKAGKAATKTAKQVEKAVKRATISIDELNILNEKTPKALDALKPSDSGNSGAKAPKMPKYNYSQMFEEVPIDSEAAKVADKIKNFFETVKSYINAGDWEGLGTDLANRFNNAIDTLNFHGFGEKVGSVIDASVRTALAFARKVDFYEVGSKIAQAFNGAMEKINFVNVGALIARSFLNIIDFLRGFVYRLNWKLVGKALSDSITGLFDEFSDWIEKLNFDEESTKLSNKIEDFITGIDWRKLAVSTMRLLKNIIRLGVMLLVDTPGKLFGDLMDKLFAKIIPNYENTPETREKAQDLGKNIVGGINVGMLSSTLQSPVPMVCKTIYDAFTSWFQISSPSKVMMGVGENISKGLFAGIEDGVKTASSTIKNISIKISNWFTGGDGNGNVFQKFYKFGENITTNLKNGISETYKNSKESLTTWSKGVKDWFTGGDGNGNIAKKFGDFASNITNKFKESIGNTYNNTKSNITAWASKTQDWFENGAGNIFDKFGGYGVGVVNRFIDKVNQNRDSTRWAMEDWKNKAHGWFSPIEGKFEESGKNSVEGFNRGVLRNMDKVKEIMQKLGAKSLQYFNEKLGIKSPSKAFMESGEDVVQGFNIGIEKNMGTTAKVVNSWAEYLKDSSLQLSFAAIDTTSLNNFDVNDYVGNVRSELMTHSKVSATGFKEGIENFYKEWLMPTITGMASDLRKQADKDEKTVVQLDGRTISESIDRQKLANGYSFTT